jgi:hypothetical protein
MDGADVKHAIGLEPADAVRYLQGKGAAVTGSWTDWLDGQHAQAFTVANVAKLDVVSDIQASLVDALKAGKTLQQWRDELIPTLQAKGWWRRDATAAQLQAAGRLNAGTGEIAKGLTPHRLKLIYETNMQSAYSAGRYQQMVSQASRRPIWQWISLQYGANRRPMHLAMHNRVFRYDDGLFATVWAPCGYGCKCRMRNYSEREATQRGLVVESTAGKLSQVDVPLRDGATARVTRYTTASMPKPGYFQPDPGFGHNAAHSVWMPRLADRPAALSAAFVRQAVEGPAFERFVRARGQLQGSFPVGVRQGAKGDPGVYLDGAELAAGVGSSVSLERLRLLPDLVEVGEQTQDGLRLVESDGILDAGLAERDGVMQVTSLSWSPKAAP